MKKIHVVVHEGHVKNGQRARAYDCMLALAVNEAVGKDSDLSEAKSSIGTSGGALFRGEKYQYTHTFQLPQEARDARYAYDLGETVHLPLEFDLTLEEYPQK